MIPVETIAYTSQLEESPTSESSKYRDFLIIMHKLIQSMIPMELAWSNLIAPVFPPHSEDFRSDDEDNPSFFQ